MSYFNTQKEFSLRDLLYRALIFIGTVGIIVYFLPRDGKFNYQFDIDKPWKYVFGVRGRYFMEKRIRKIVMD